MFRRSAHQFPTTAALALAAATLALVACGCNSSAAPGGTRKVSVRYDVTGSFTGCTVFYITRKDDVTADEVNAGGQVLDEDVTLPWSTTFDVTVDTMHPFNSQIDAVCSAQDDATVNASITIDGTVADTDTQSGQNVSAGAAQTVTTGN